MNFLISVLSVIFGFFLLIKGADTFVDGASKIARKFGIPSIIIGLTIVAMGTSLPELMVSITSSLSGKNDMCIANVTGSNFFNICIGLGIPAIIMKNKYDSKSNKNKKSFLKSIFLKELDLSSKFVLLANIILLIGALIDNKVGRIDGLLLIIGLIFYIITLIKNSKASNLDDNDNQEVASISILKQILLVILGSTGIIVGGNLVVEHASNIGKIVGLSENLIGMTIVAMGTSLPELVTSVVAIKKGEHDMALGNIMGSNILNILLVVGISSLASPIMITTTALCDIIITFLMTLLTTIILTKRDNILSKNLGIIYVLTYLSYTILAIIR